MELHCVNVAAGLTGDEALVPFLNATAVRADDGLNVRFDLHKDASNCGSGPLEKFTDNYYEGAVSVSSRCCRRRAASRRGPVVEQESAGPEKRRFAPRPPQGRCGLPDRVGAGDAALPARLIGMMDTLAIDDFAFALVCCDGGPAQGTATEHGMGGSASVRDPGARRRYEGSAA